MIMVFSLIVLIHISEGVRLSLRGVPIANNSYVGVDDIGEGDDALLCHTNKPDCCHYIFNRAGEWYYPDGTRVGLKYDYDEFYRNRGIGIVRLNHQQEIFTARGRFRCEVPDASSMNQILFVNIGMF
jgi:hypothetical protein